MSLLLSHFKEKKTTRKYWLRRTICSLGVLFIGARPDIFHIYNLHHYSFLYDCCKWVSQTESHCVLQRLYRGNAKESFQFAINTWIRSFTGNRRIDATVPAYPKRLLTFANGLLNLTVNGCSLVTEKTRSAVNRMHYWLVWQGWAKIQRTEMKDIEKEMSSDFGSLKNDWLTFSSDLKIIAQMSI